MAKESVTRCPWCGSTEVSESPSGGECFCWSCHTTFSPSDCGDTAGGTRPRIALFMSYAHADGKMPLMVLTELKGHSYEVIFDRQEGGGIRPGDDWRERIAEMIASSPDGVVAILSENSLRPGGVCLDELSIAVGGYGQWDSQRRVWPVLISPEGELTIPPTVARTQWLDLSSWREAAADGEKGLSTWISGRMGELFSAIEDPETKRLRGDVATIAGLLPVPTETPRLAALLRRGLSGRTWLTDDVRNWLLDGGAPQVCVVWGGPGTGKSAWAAHLAHYGLGMNARVAAALFLERDFNAYDDPCTFVQSLAALLSFELPQYRRALVGTLVRHRDEIESLIMRGRAEELFDLLLGKPLSCSLNGGHEPMLVIVDGLDETEDEKGGNPVAKTLGRIISRLPPWMRFLLTSRDVESVHPALPPHEVREIRLENRAEECDADVRGYLEDRLAGLEGGRELARAVASHAEGVFLYAELVADAALTPGAPPLHDDELPRSLGRAISLWFRTTFPDPREYARCFRTALGCLLAVGGPLPCEELGRILGWSGSETADFLRKARPLLNEGRDASGNQTAAMSHDFVSEWLTSDLAGEYRANSSDGARTVASRYFKLARENPGSLTDYELLRILPLLETAGMREELDTISRSSTFLERMARRAAELGKAGRHAEALELAHAARGAISGREETPASLRACAASALAGEDEHFGRLAEAESLRREVLGTWRSLEESETGLHLIDVSSACHDLAATLRDRGELAEAESLFREALEIRRGLAGTDPATNLPGVATSCLDLAVILRDRGDLAGAESLGREALGIRRDLADADPGAWLPAVATACGNLATTLHDRGGLAEAESLFREALSISRHLSDSDPGTYRPGMARSCLDLATTLRDRGDLAEAESLFSEALRTYRTLAEDSPGAWLPDVAAACLDLAVIFRDRGDLAGAERLGREALTIRRDLADADPGAWLPYVATACGNLAATLRDRGELDEAESLFRKALKIRQGLADSDPGAWLPGAARSYGNLAATLRDRGKLAEAESLFRKALEIRRELADSDPGAHLPGVATSCLDLAVVLRERGDLAGAERLGREALKIRSGLADANPGTWLPAVATACGNLAIVLRDRGDLAGAESLFHEALKIRCELADSDPGAWLPGAARSYDNLAAILYDRGELAEAESLFRKALEMRRELAYSDPGAHLPGVATSCLDLAEVLLDRGDVKGAQDLGGEALEIWRKLAEDDPGIYSSHVARARDLLSRASGEDGPTKATGV
jgi:tetratricopeptide (TPR) repeat protein